MSDVASSSGASSFSIAKWFALLGTAIQASLFVGIGFFLWGALQTFREITAAGTSDPRFMAEGLGEALVPVVLALGIGGVGTFISFVTALVSKYRARWFFYWSLPFAIVQSFLFPNGTLAAVPWVIFLLMNRRQFLHAAAPST